MSQFDIQVRQLVKDQCRARGHRLNDPHMKLNILCVVLLATVAVIRASDSPDVPYPREFRSWQHVKSIVIGPEHRSFQVRGGIHHYYANEQAMKGYRTGKFPNGSVIVDEAVFTKDGEGPAKGILLEGDRRALDVMVKNDRLYKDTGGWGFDHFDGDTKTGTLNTEARGKCQECHAKAKRDHVYSSVRP
jgi:Cytochrome P460